jgi:hypothetical protein
MSRYTPRTLAYYDLEGVKHDLDLDDPHDKRTFGRITSDEYRRVAKDRIDDVVVSTVLLSIDHSFGGDVPIIFETMVFGYEEQFSFWRRLAWLFKLEKPPEYEQEFCWRYATKDEALAGHNKVVQAVRRGRLDQDAL